MPCPNITCPRAFAAVEEFRDALIQLRSRVLRVKARVSVYTSVVRGHTFPCRRLSNNSTSYFFLNLFVLLKNYIKNILIKSAVCNLILKSNIRKMTSMSKQAMVKVILIMTYSVCLAICLNSFQIFRLSTSIVLDTNVFIFGYSLLFWYIYLHMVK